jgi:hypothetical protein
VPSIAPDVKPPSGQDNGFHPVLGGGPRCVAARSTALPSSISSAAVRKKWATSELLPWRHDFDGIPTFRPEPLYHLRSPFLRGLPGHPLGALLTCPLRQVRPELGDLTQQLWRRPPIWRLLATGLLSAAASAPGTSSIPAQRGYIPCAYKSGPGPSRSEPGPNAGVGCPSSFR